MKVRTLAVGLVLAVVVWLPGLSVGMYFGYDLRRDTEPEFTVETVHEQVVWMQTRDGTWWCEPWATLSEALRKCDAADLPPHLTLVEAREVST